MDFPEGKLSIKLLKKLLELNGSENEGILLNAGIGKDATVIDITVAKEMACAYYELPNDTKCHLVLKSDPITFPTDQPGKYAVIINSNDVVTQGAVPFGFLSSIIVPTLTKWEELYQIQHQIDTICKEKGISVVGGHTEKSGSTKAPIISGMMFGFVPSDFLPDGNISEGDKILQVGWTAAEGTSILLSSENQAFLSEFSEKELEQAKKISNTLDIGDSALNINKKYQPHIIHDCTEGGVLGALFEMFSPLRVGIRLNDNFPIHPVTEHMCSLLNINPLRLISSGAFLCVISSQAAEELVKNQQKFVPIKIIGEITTKDEKMMLKDSKLKKPGPDEIIRGLKNLKNYS